MPRELPLCPPCLDRIKQLPNSQLSLSFGRPIDRAAWKAAGDVIIHRHPTLRTALARNGRSLLEADKLEATWNEPDWSAVSNEDLPGLWKELQTKEALEAFVPAELPAWRLYLLSLPGEQSHFLWTLDPYLLDELSAGQILTEWFELYDNGIRSTDGVVPTASLSAALGAAELPEDYPPVVEAFVGLSRWAAYPFLLGDTTSTDREQKSCEIPPAAWQGLEVFAQREGVTPGAVITALWAGLFASWNPSAQSLTATTVDLRPFLPSECPDLRGRMLLPVPFRFSFPTESKDEAWLPAAARAVDNLASGAFTPWVQAASDAARRLQLPTLPISTVQWQQHSLNDLLHTAFPRWLGADARWQEAPPSPIVLRILGEKRPLLSLEWAQPYLSTEWADHILHQLISGLSSLDNLSAWPSSATKPASPDFRLQALPEPGLRLTEALRNGQAVVELGEERLDASELLARSNQWLRFFRKNRPQPEERLLVSLPAGVDLLLTLLALLRDRVDFIVLPPKQLPALSTEDFTRLRVGLILTESGTASAAWPPPSAEPASGEVEEQAPEALPAKTRPKTLLLEEIREKISSQPDGLPGDRKTPIPPTWCFLQPDGSEEIITEALLGEAWTGLGDWWDLDTESHLLWPVDSLQPRHLVELALLLEKSGTLLLPDRELFASRSEFEGFIAQNNVTHLSLTATRWADWMQYNREVDSRLPETLRSLLLETGTWSQNTTSRWIAIAAETRTHLWFSPVRLPGLGFHWSTAPGEFPQLPLLPLGQADSTIQAHIQNASGQILADGLPGNLTISLPPAPDLSADGPSFISATFPGLRTPDGIFWALESPDHACRLPWPLQQIHGAKLANQPEILDALLDELATDSEALRAWLVLRDRPATIPEKVAEKLREAQIEEVALLARFPLDANGRLQRTLLPATLPLAQLLAKSAPTAGKPTVSAKPSHPQQKSVSPPARPVELHWLRPPTPSPALNLLAYAAKPTTTGASGAWVAQLEVALAEADLGGCGRLSPPGSILSSAWLDEATELLRNVPNLSLVARGDEVWDVVRLAHWLEKAGFPPSALYLLEPAQPQPEALQNLAAKVKSAFRWLGPKTANARREAPTAPRLVPIHIPCQVLLPEGRTEAFEQILLQANYYAADLSTPEKSVEALLSLLLEGTDDDAEPNESDKPNESSADESPTDPPSTENSPVEKPTAP